MPSLVSAVASVPPKTRSKGKQPKHKDTTNVNISTVPTKKTRTSNTYYPSTSSDLRAPRELNFHRSTKPGARANDYQVYAIVSRGEGTYKVVWRHDGMCATFEEEQALEGAVQDVPLSDLDCREILQIYYDNPGLTPNQLYQLARGFWKRYGRGAKGRVCTRVDVSSSFKPLDDLVYTLITDFPVSSNENFDVVDTVWRNFYEKGHLCIDGSVLK